MKGMRRLLKFQTQKAVSLHDTEKTLSKKIEVCRKRCFFPTDLRNGAGDKFHELRLQLAWKWKSIRQHDNSFRRPGVMDYRLPGQASNSQPFRFLEILASVFNSLPLIRNPPSTNSADLPRPASAAGKLKRTKFQQDQSSPSISTASPASSREENKERTKMVVFLFSLASVFRSLFSRNVRAYPFFFQ